MLQYARGGMVFTLLSCGLYGCASDPPAMMWQRPDTPLQQRIQDESRCGFHVEQLAGPTHFLSAEQAKTRDQYRDTLLNHCMRAAGYQQVPEG